MNSLSQSIHQWLRQWLGTHGYTRALKDRAKRARLDEIVERIATGELDGHEVRAVFAEAARRQKKIDDVFATLVAPERITTPATPRRGTERAGSTAAAPTPRYTPAPTSRYTSGPTPTTAPSAPPPTAPAVEAELRSLRTEIDLLRRHAADLESLARSLVERAVLDATRIHGLESVIMAIANGSGIGKDAEEVYGSSTGDFLRNREHLLKRALAA